MTTATARTYFYGVGRRKTSVARVQLVAGSGQVVINGQPLRERFSRLLYQTMVMQPLRVTNTAGDYNAVVRVVGGGDSGQAGAISHAVARALIRANAEFRPLLRKAGLLTRDPRIKERKKYGLKRARKAPQYTKR
ncbi:MAG: 30S ribosomal protein S9 [Chloroflexi bacterium]|nr:30S ribosomal protein S9 [Chloroflexota bacterium]MBI4507478.1 30S ribosomal protein S9 [Chloroflexota bacterium]